MFNILVNNDIYSLLSMKWKKWVETGDTDDKKTFNIWAIVFKNKIAAIIMMYKELLKNYRHYNEHIYYVVDLMVSWK